jgi:cellulose synthase/poly-beta-1,6-N-acetylglucosamine synthase-like glycosyltransferase
MTIVAVSIALLGATWVVYPLAMWLLARLRPDRKAQWNGELPMVTVVLATREPPAAVSMRIQNLLESEYPPDRLGVAVGVDRASAPAGAAYGFPDPRVTFVDAPPPGGKAMALNAAIAQASGEVLVFTDTAQSFAATAIGHLVASLGEDGTGAVSGALHTEAGEGGLVDAYWRMERALRRNEGRVSSTVGVTGAIYALRRDLWTPLPPGLILDDLYVPMRVVLSGARVGFSESAVAYDERRFRSTQEYRRKVRTLTGVLQLCAWLPAVLNPLRDPIWLQFIFHKLLRFATPVLLLALGAGILIEAWAALARATSSATLIGVALVMALAIVAVMALRRIRRLAWEGVMMQTAVLQAIVNAIRGRWDVWRT